MAIANNTQIGGSHYQNSDNVGYCPHCGGEIQHWDLYARQPYLEGIITKWVTRWRFKGGVADLRKAQHAIEKLVEW